MKKLLFVDVPFLDRNGMEDKRSLFIWDCLHRHFEADLLLLKTPEYLTRKIPEFRGFNQLYSLATSNAIHPGSGKAYQFTCDNRDKFIQIITSNRYDLIFLRRECCLELALLAEEILPKSQLVIDLEQLASECKPATETPTAAWAKVAHQVSQFHLKAREKALLQKPYHFFFASDNKKSIALRLANLKDDSPNFHVLPPALPEKLVFAPVNELEEQEKKLLSDKFILFFGDLGTPANLDAFLHLTKDIYPRISKTLQEKDIKIYVAGPHQQRVHTLLTGGRIKLIPRPELLNNYLRACLLVILPQRLSDRSSADRILTTAMMQKAVLTTTTGCGNYQFTTAEIAFENNPDAFCNRLAHLLVHPAETLEMGRQLEEKVRQFYGREGVERNFLGSLEAISASSCANADSGSFSVALVSEACGYASGKVGNHVYQLAKSLAKSCQVTVICPKTKATAKLEATDNLKIIYVKDFLKYTGRGATNQARAFCPGLLVQLLKGDYDIIQVFPGLTINSMLAFLTAKLREIPLLISILDCKHSAIRWWQIPLLRYADWLFTATEKDYATLRKYTERVEQLPMPVQIDSEKADRASIRQQYGFGEDSFIFLCLGKICRFRGQDIALKAFIKALPALPNAKLILVGNAESDSAFREELDELVSQESLQEEVCFTGEVERGEVLAWLKESDLQVIPARSLNIGNVVIESWASGTPVLQSDAVDPNLVIDYHNGLLFRSEDADDLAQQMQFAFGHRAALKAMAEHGKVLVGEKYTFAYLAKKYLETYKQLTF
jgi:glycosyltransferase involved in cell wall biosynthesis